MSLIDMCVIASGIEKPIVQGGMHYVGYAEMAAAVSNAGGLGIITALTITANGGPEALRKEIRKCRTLTSKPFGVNCTLLPVLSPPDWPAIIQVIIDEGITVVETAGRAPDVTLPIIRRLIAFFFVVIRVGE